MNETTRKYYITKGEEFERTSDYEGALSSYLEAFFIKECLNNDNPDYFNPGFIEDRIAFLAYRIGDYRKALTFGGLAYRANPSDERLKNNLAFYTDAILFTNPKKRLDDYIKNYVLTIAPQNARVLDIGPYDGRWSDYLREFFPNIDAVEAFEPYIDHFNLREKYNNIFIEDTRNFEFDFYDVIIMGDVLEHMPIEDAQKLASRLYQKCNHLIIIIPYEYPQDEYDNNEYQIHYQEDLTNEIFLERYKGFKLLACDEVRGAYIKETEIECAPMIFGAENNYSKTFTIGKTYFDFKDYIRAIGVFNNSLEVMSDENKALIEYYKGLSYLKLEKTLEAVKSFSTAVELLPSYRDAYFELFKILEKLEFWSDFEFYLKKALEHKNEISNIDTRDQKEWEGLLLIQLTLALSKQKKYFEAYGFASLAKDYKMSEEKSKIALYNYEQLNKELWGTLQI